MIPIKESRELVSSGSEESIAFGISAKDSIHIMSILRDQLYSDKIMAVLREIGANAQDANAAAGRRDVPIEVTLPTLADPTLRIRDRGPGLSLDDVRTVFSQYGASTKRESNEAVGMLGIGSKSPFAYSDSFVVTSWHGGHRAIYNAVIDPSGAGQIDLLAVDACDPNETGVEISLGIRPVDCKAFEERARQLFVHFEPRPRINIELPPPVKTVPVTDGAIDDSDSYYSGKWVAVMGCIPYAISLEQLLSGTGGSELSKAVLRVSGALRFGIGELAVAASRESLKYGDQTRALLIERLNAAITEYVKSMLEGLDGLSNWERRLRVLAVAQRQLPVPPDLRKYTGAYVHLKDDPKASAMLPQRGRSPEVIGIEGRPFGVQTRDYNGRMQRRDDIAIARKTRFVVWDERRSMAGYRLESGDHVVRPTAGNEDRTNHVLKELDGMCRDLSIDGIEVVLLSSIPWVRPNSGRPDIPRDSERAKARSFVLDLALASKRDHSGPLSKLWIPSRIVASDSDVFAVLEGYRVPDHDSFYDAVRDDSVLVRNLGLAFPPIVGYKDTKARPISASSCKGTEYRKWRVSGLPRLLMTSPVVEQAVIAMSHVRQGQYDRWYDGGCPSGLAEELGADHDLARLLMEENRSRTATKSLSPEVRAGAEFVRNSRYAEALWARGDAARQALTDRYPLLAVAGPGAFTGNNRGLWIDYVRLIDSLSLEAKLKQRSQEAT